MLIQQFTRYQRARGFAPQTARRRAGTLRRFAEYLEPTTIDRATLADVEEWLSQFPAPRTRHAYRSDLRVFYAWATARELLPSNPTTLVDPVKVPRSLPRPLGPEVFGALVVGSRRARRMVALGLFAGLRAAEIAGLDSSDVATWSQPPTITVRNGKGGKDRVVPMHRMLVDLLRDLPAGPVFPNSAGRPILPDSASRAVRRQLGLVGIDATCHQLRHTFGTEAARASGGNVVLVAYLMGHSDTNTTMGYIGWVGESAETIAHMFDAGRRAA